MLNVLDEAPVLLALALVMAPACVFYFVNRAESWTRRLWVLAPSLALVAVFMLSLVDLERRLATPAAPSAFFWWLFHAAFVASATLVVPASLAHRGSRWFLLLHGATLYGAFMLYLLAGLVLSNFPDGWPVG